MANKWNQQEQGAKRRRSNQGTRGSTQPAASNPNKNRKSTDTNRNRGRAAAAKPAPKAAPKAAPKQAKPKTVYYRSKDDAKPVYKNPAKTKPKTQKPVYYSKDNARPVMAAEYNKNKKTGNVRQTIGGAVKRAVQANANAAKSKPAFRSRDYGKEQIKRPGEMNVTDYAWQTQQQDHKAAHNLSNQRKARQMYVESGQAALQRDLAKLDMRSGSDRRGKSAADRLSIDYKTGKWYWDGKEMTQSQFDQQFPMGLSDPTAREMAEKAGYIVNTRYFPTKEDEKDKKQEIGWVARNMDKYAGLEDDNVSDADAYDLMSNRRKFAQAQVAGDKAAMERYHQANEAIRAKYGYSGGVSGDQVLRGNVSANEYAQLNETGDAALSNARRRLVNARTPAERERIQKEIDWILINPDNQAGEENKHQIRDLTKGSVLSSIGNTAVQLRNIRDMNKYAGADDAYNAVPKLWQRVSELYDQMGNTTDEKQRAKIQNQIDWLTDQATAMEQEQEKWATDPNSPYFDPTVAERLGMPTSVQPNRWDEMAERGDQLIAGAKEGMNAGQSFAADLYSNAIQMIPTTVAGLIPGVGGASVGAKLWNAARAATQTAALTQMGLAEGGNRYRELVARGVPEEQARTDALMSTAISMGTESVPLHYLGKLVSGTQRIGRTIPGAIASSFALEGTEEGVSYAANALWSWMRGYEQDRFDWGEMGKSMLAGGIMGGLHAGLGVAVNRAVTHLTSQGREQDANRVQAYMDDIDGIMEQSQQYEEMVRQGALSAEEGAAIQSQLQQDLVGKMQSIQDHVRTIDSYQSMADQGIISQDTADRARNTYGQELTGQETIDRAGLEQAVSQRLYQAALAANAMNTETPAQVEARQAAERTGRVQDMYRRGQSVMGAYQADREAQPAREIREAQRDAVAQLQVETPPITYERSGLPPTSFLGAAIDARREARARAEAEAQVRRDQEIARQNRVAAETAPNTVPTVSKLSPNAETGQQTFVPNAPTQQQNVPVSYQNQQAQQPVSRLESLASTFGESGAASLRTIGGKMLTGQGAFVRDFTDVYNQVLGGRSESQVSRPAGMSDANYFAAVTAARNDRQTGWDLDILKASKAAGRNVNAGVDWRDQYVRQMDRKTARTVDGLAKALGVKVVFAEKGSILTAGGTAANAEITGNVVRIEKGNPNPVRMLIGHELTHRMQDVSPESYRAFRDYAMSVPGSMEALERTVSLYQRAGAFRAQDNARQMAMDEVTADFAGDLLENSEQLQEFIRRNYENRTMLEVIRDFFRDLAAKLTGREKAQADEAVRLLEDAIKGASQRVKGMERMTVADEALELSDVNTLYSIRKEDPPKKTGVAYKVFFAKNGQLYPPMVANPGGEGTPVGVWLNADVGQQAAPSKSGRQQVKAGGKGTQGGSGSLAFRPGWHLGDIPRASQFDRKNPETGKKELFPANFVWAECEYAADVDYQDEAMSYGYTENGKFRHAYAGLPRLPENGYYRYRTNPKPDTVPWIITGAMRVTRVLTDAETDAICRENGVEPAARQGGPMTAERMEKELGIKAGDTTEESKRFSLSAPVEETDRFIASHNLNAEKMRGALELGGLAMPSVAMTPANIAHTGYGDITVVFGKDSVNPKDKRNQIFSDDAYTPTVPAAGYKISSDVTKRLRERIDALLDGLPSDLRSKVALDTDNIRDNIQRWGEDFGKVYGDNIALKTAYLIDQGENIKVPMRYEATRSGMDKATLRKAIRMFGDMDKLNSADKLDAFIEPARELERQYYREKFSKKPELADTIVKNFGWSDVDKLLNDARWLKKHGDLRKITDLDALGKTVSRKLGTKKKQAAFEDWLRRESEGIIEKKGIRNNKDIFTRTGNRRSFEQLYDDYNLANIVKAMQQDVKQGKVGFLTGSGNIRGAAAKTYGSIEDARKEIGRIRETGEDEDFTAQYKAFDQRCRDLCAEMTDGTRLKAWDAAEALTETLAKHKTEPAIYRYLMKEWGSDGYLNVTPEIAQEAAELIKEAQKLPIHYMEAKLYRAVDLTEPLAYVVPSNLDKDLKQQMKDAGLPMKTYKAGDREDRLNKVNAVKGARFSLGGINAQTANVQRLSEAKKMERKGKTEEEIRQATGWLKGPDGKWRFEIGDVDASFDFDANARRKQDIEEARDLWPKFYERFESQDRPDAVWDAYYEIHDMIQKAESQADAWFKMDRIIRDLKAKGYETDDLRNLADAELDRETNPYADTELKERTLADYLDHPALFQAYPELRDTMLRFADLGKKTNGQYNPQDNEILLNKKLTTEDEVLDTLSHEVQHAIQHIEGFASGASPEYWETRRNAGWPIRTKGEQKKLRELREKLADEYDENEALVDDVMRLNRITPTVPRGEVDWDTLEQIEEDPPEWQEFDRQREALEAKYGDMKVFDLMELVSEIERLEKGTARTPRELYWMTAGEVEAREVADRREMSEDERRKTPPRLGGDDVVFANGARYSITPQADADYMAAVESGDMETAQRMVDEAAKAAGYTIKAYHGTPKRFNEFSKYRIGSTTDYGWFGRGFYFTTEKDVADVYAGYLQDSNVIEAYLNVHNPFVFTEYPGGEDMSPGEIMEDVLGTKYGRRGELTEDDKAQRSEDFTEWLAANGYDGVEIWSQIMILESEQAKRTDPVTYDDNGNVIPLSERFNAETGDIRYSIGTHDSEGYALSEGQREYFKDSQVTDERGNLIPVYHGGAATTAFTGRGNGYAYNPNAIFMTDSREIAEAFARGATVHKLYANIKNPLVLDAEGRFYTDIPIPDDAPESLKDEFWFDGTADADNLAVYAEEHGYDGVIIHNVREGVGGDPMMDVIAFRSNQVKNTDNKYPTEEDDIRYSLGTEGYDRARLMRENQELKEKLEYWRGQVKKSDRTKADPKEVRKLAKSLRTDYSTDMDAGEITQRLQAIYDGIGKDWSYDRAYEEAGKLARDMIEQATATEDYLYAEYEPMRKFFQDTPLVVTKEMQRAIPDYNEWRKPLFGKLRLKGGEQTNVDQVFQEAVERWPEFFNEEVSSHSLDQLDRIVEVLDNVYRREEINPFEDDMSAPAGYLATAIMDMYWDIPAVKKTFADRMQNRLNRQIEKTNQAKEQGRERVQKVREQKNQKIKKTRTEAKAEERERMQAKMDRKIEETQVNANWHEAKSLFEAEWVAAKRRHERNKKYKQALQKVREQRDRKLKEQSERYLTAKKKRSQKQKERELRAKIQRHANKLSTKLTRPTDTQHIPEALIDTVRTALESINLSSGFTVVQLPNGKTKRVKDGSGEKTSRTQAFEALRKMYQEMETNGSEVVIDPDLIPNISDIIGFADTPIANLGLEDLNTIWQTVRAIEASISTFNKALGRAKFETISQPAFGIRDYLTGRKDRGDYRGPFRQMDKLLNFNMLTPEAYFLRMGNSGKEVFRMLRDAQDRHITIMDQAQRKTREIIGKTDIRKLEKEKHTFTFDGETVELTTAQIMSLYELMKRQQAVDHVMIGGIRPESVKKGIKDLPPARPWHLTQDQVSEVVDSLTPEQVKLADELQKYMGGTMAELGNEASMEVYGYRKFTEKHYFPISVDKNQTHSDVKNDAVSGTIAGWGSARPVKPNANNAVILRSIFDVYADHTTEMAYYASWLAPMENMNRIFNFRYKDAEGNQTGTMKDQLETLFGKNGEAYWKQLQNDLNNGVHGRDDSPFSAFMGTYKASAIGANIRVIAQQPTAILRAMDSINPADFVAGMARARWGKFEKVVKQYAPIAIWKDWGYFQQDTGRQMRNVLFNDDTKLQKANSAMMWGAGKADSLSWTAIWNALESETRRKRKDLRYKSREFYEAVAERFNEVVDHTQVVDGILQRSQIMRSADGLTKMATSFMAEPTKTYNMMLSAIYEARNAKGRERSAAMGKLAKTAFALTVSITVNAAAQSLVDAIRDDDKDEDYWEKFIQAYFGLEGDTRKEQIKNGILNGNLEAAFNPLTYIPYLKDIVSQTQGYSVSRMDMDTISRVLKAFTNVEKAMSGEGKNTKQSAWLNLTAEIARFLGVPAANIKRDIQTITRTFFAGTGNYRMLYAQEKFLYDVTSKNTLTEFSKLILGAERAGDDEAAQAIRQDMIDSGVDAEKIDKKLAELRKKAVTDTEEFQTALAQKTDAYNTMLEASEQFQAFAEDQQTKARGMVEDYAEWQAYGDQVVLGEKDQAAYDKMQEAESNHQIDPALYAICVTAFADMHNDKDENGNDIEGQHQQDKVIRFIKALPDLTNAQRSALYHLKYDNDKNNPWA